jgi:methanogenic corrinoid protein MtbC1
MTYSLEPPAPSETRVALLAALVDGDLGGAYDIASELLAEGVGFESLLGDVLAPVQSELGRRWVDGDLTVADEHAATATAEGLVALLVGTIAPTGGQPVVVTSPSGDAHSLPGRVVAATFAVRGLRAVFLGASVPATDLAEYLEHQEPAALALSVSMPSALLPAADAVAVAHALAIPVVVGGRAFRGSPARAAKIGADAFATHPGEAADLVTAWARQPPTALGPTLVAPPETDRIEGAAPAIVASVIATCSPGAVTITRWLAEELGRLLDVVRAALALDDPEVLVEHVAALREAGPAHGVPRGALDAALAALTTALRTDCPDGAALVEAARG